MKNFYICIDPSCTVDDFPDGRYYWSGKFYTDELVRGSKTSFLNTFAQARGEEHGGYISRSRAKQLMIKRRF